MSHVHCIVRVHITSDNSQGHFGSGGTLERLNTTLPQWEAAGILPVNRVSFFELTDQGHEYV